MGGTTRTRRSRPVTRDENAYFLLKKKVGKENFHKAPVRKVMQTRAAKKTFIRRALRASFLGQMGGKNRSVFHVKHPDGAGGCFMFHVKHGKQKESAGC